MKVLAIGSRKWKKHEVIARVITRVHKRTPIDLLVEIGRSGAETMIYDVGLLLGVQVATFHPNPYRHQEDADLICLLRAFRIIKPDRVLIFNERPIKQKAMKELIRAAKKSKVKVRVVTK